MRDRPDIGYGLGLVVIETPVGRLVGHDGAIPGFFNILLSTEDGHRQFGIMMNENFATPAVSEAFEHAFMTFAMRREACRQPVSGCRPGDATFVGSRRRRLTPIRSDRRSAAWTYVADRPAQTSGLSLAVPAGSLTIGRPGRGSPCPAGVEGMECRACVGSSRLEPP